MQRPRAEVDIRPVQTEQLTTAQTHGQRQDEQHFQPVIGSNSQEAACTIAGKRRTLSRIRETRRPHRLAAAR
ncbi:hypothetical protein [Parafrankia sp. FMc2]|uniref:hypothetical protein n=1 Tax=Parafrankia sp. FMc2 TaxID=3233196 RepID=UPI0034D70908